MKRTRSKTVRQRAQRKVTLDARELDELRGTLAASSNAQAVIECELDGTIRTANEMFLQLLGYTLVSVHNLYFIEHLMQEIRSAIRSDSLANVVVADERHLRENKALFSIQFRSKVPTAE